MRTKPVAESSGASRPAAPKWRNRFGDAQAGLPAVMSLAIGR